MEFEKGKFYELESEIVAIVQYVGLSPLSKDTFIYTYCSIDQLIGFDCSLSEYDKVINTFDNIHEVSKRVKELEKEELKKGDYNEALNLKEASEKAGKACKEYGEAINMATNSEIVSVTKMEPSEGVKAILPELSKLHKEAMHEILLQIRKKYLS